MIIFRYIGYWIYWLILKIHDKDGRPFQIFIFAFIFASSCAVTLPTIQTRGGSLYLFKDAPDSEVTQDRVNTHYVNNSDIVLLHRVKLIKACFKAFPEDKKELLSCLKGNKK